MRLICTLMLFMAFDSQGQIPQETLRPLQNEIGGLKEEDQRYFKNEAFAGRNQLERIDRNVVEINKLHSDLALLKLEVHELKKQIEELKKSK